MLVLNYMGPMVRMAQEKEKGIKQALLLKGMSPVYLYYSIREHMCFITHVLLFPVLLAIIFFKFENVFE